MAAGVKLATAYVQIVASAAGVRKDVAKELNLVAGDAEKTGRTSGKKMSAGLAKGVDAKGFRKRLFSGVDKDAAGAGKRAAEPRKNDPCQTELARVRSEAGHRHHHL